MIFQQTAAHFKSSMRLVLPKASPVRKTSCRMLATCSSKFSGFRLNRSSIRSILPVKRCPYTTSASEPAVGESKPAAEDLGAPSTVGVFTLGNVNDQESHSRMLTLVFTCNVCETRSARQFSHHSYTKGVVIIQCPGCEKHHLIADHLGWFLEGKDVEEFMANKGETVRKITNADEVTPEIQAYVDQAVQARSEAMKRRAAYVARREKERAELAQAEAEERAKETQQIFDETLEGSKSRE